MLSSMVIIALTKLWASRFIKKLIYFFFFTPALLKLTEGEQALGGPIAGVEKVSLQIRQRKKQ